MCRCPCGEIQQRAPPGAGASQQPAQQRAPSRRASSSARAQAGAGAGAGAGDGAGQIVQCNACGKHLRWPGGPMCRCPCGQILRRAG